MAFEVGQKWTIKDSGMTIVIGEVEPYPGNKTAVSISVFDVPLPPQSGQPTVDVAHVPFDEQALLQSVDKLVGTGAAPAPDFAGGYNGWKKAKGGIFTVPVTKLPEMLF